jgi:PleD family two-component response regulator
MSGMDGKECLMELKSIEAIQNVPIIMYSGANDDGQVERYKKLGASEYIFKPSRLAELRDILSSIVKLPL